VLEECALEQRVRVVEDTVLYGARTRIEHIRQVVNAQSFSLHFYHPFVLFFISMYSITQMTEVINMRYPYFY